MIWNFLASPIISWRRKFSMKIISFRVITIILFFFCFRFFLFGRRSRGAGALSGWQFLPFIVGGQRCLVTPRNARSFPHLARWWVFEEKKRGKCSFFGGGDSEEISFSARCGMGNFLLLLAFCSYQFSCSIRLASRVEEAKNLLFLSYFLLLSSCGIIFPLHSNFKLPSWILIIPIINVPFLIFHLVSFLANINRESFFSEF